MKARQAVYALSYGSSFTSTILVPTVNQEEIDAMLPVEARKYIPISLSKVTLDWLPLGTHGEERVTNVLLSAVYNEAKEQYEMIMRGCRLSPIASEIEIFSTIRSTVTPEDETVIVLDLGASATRLYIVEKGVITKTHSTPLSGVELTRSLSAGLSIAFEQAEEIKREKGLLNGTIPEAQKILAQTLERGTRELNTVIKRHSEKQHVTIQKAMLSGGGALLQGVVPYLSDAFSLPVEVADPFAKVAYPAFLEDTLTDAGSSFAVAIGAALRGFQNIK
jgi:type IV pilus assembly protein PilM